MLLPGSADRSEIERLRAENDRYRLQIEHMPIGCMVADPDMTVREWNPAAERIFGFTREEIVGRVATHMIVPPDVLPQVTELLAGLGLARETAVRVNENVTKSGDRILCRWDSTPLFDASDRFVGILAMCQDITDAHHTERALAENEQRMSLALSATREGVWDWNLETGRVYYSPRYFAMLGYEPGELPGERPTWEHLVHPDDLPRATAAVENGLRKADGTWELEYRMRTKDGKWRYIHSHAFVGDRDAEGRPLRVVGTHRDVTDQKALEEQLRQSQKLEVVGQLAGGIAHDFNNLLTAISGYVDLAADARGAKDRKELLAAARASIERATVLTQQLLAYSRRQVRQPRPIDVADAVRRIENLLSRVIGERIEIRTRLAENANVVADPLQIEQILLNLGVNARDAMPKGGTLTITVANTRLDAGQTGLRGEWRPGPHVALAVRDTGCGIEPEVVDRIFDPFFTTKPADKGTGLGLSTVLGIVGQNGGAVGVESTPGNGATFTVYLPSASEPGFAEDPVAAAEGTAARGTETILLAEDDAAVRSITRSTLQSLGYTVLTGDAVDDVLALGLAGDVKIDLLITDLVMPRLGGHELAARLRTARPDLRVLFVSGYNPDPEVERAIRAENAPFLQKPFRPAVLAAKVREILDGV